MARNFGLKNRNDWQDQTEPFLIRVLLFMSFGLLDFRNKKSDTSEKGWYLNETISMVVIKPPRFSYNWWKMKIRSLFSKNGEEKTRD